MEDVLDLYAEPPNPERPVVCFDEMPYQLLSHVREPERCAPGRAEREDYEYRRERTCNFFLAFAPYAGRRHVEATQQRTAIDVAHQLQALSDVHFPTAERIRLVWDNLRAHPLRAVPAFAPEEARRIARRFELHYTPKHGSWLNMAELEWSVLSRQSLDQRLESRERAAEVLRAWESRRNQARATVTWRFTTQTARARLNRLYPALPT